MTPALIQTRADLSGIFKLTSSENFNEFLKEIGINFFWRYLYNVSTDNLEIAKNGNGYVIKTFVNNSLFYKSGLHFMRQELVFGQPDQQLQFNGKRAKTVVRMDKGKLIEETKIDGKLVQSVYQIKGNELMITTSAGNVSSNRFYRRKQNVEQKYFSLFERIISVFGTILFFIIFILIMMFMIMYITKYFSNDFYRRRVVETRVEDDLFCYYDD